MTAPVRGTLYAGTSGFAYGAWIPRFYPVGTRASGLLPAYATSLNAVELNNTFYRQPTAAAIAGWLAATPSDFRFVVKAQRGAAWRALRADAGEAVSWLVAAYRPFGERLRCVLLRVDDATARDDAALDRFLEAWPPELPLALELRHPSWEDDAVIDRLRQRDAALVVTDADELPEPPVLRRTGPLLYVRLRRTTYSSAELAAWAARFDVFLDDGVDVCVFLRHDADGSSALAAASLLQRRREG